jgi:hypothetical protein
MGFPPPNDDEAPEPVIVGGKPVGLIPSISDQVAYRQNMEAIDRAVGATAYPYIVAWGKWLGFTPATVLGYLEQAEADGAPLDATQKIDGVWLRLDDIMNDTNRKRVESLVGESSKRKR